MKAAGIRHKYDIHGPGEAHDLFHRSSCAQSLHPSDIKLAPLKYATSPVDTDVYGNMSCLSSPPAPPCSLLTSCSSWSCCYLKSRLVARVETPARPTMAECPPCPRPFWLHQPLPARSPAWLRPSRVSSWVAWVCSRSQTLGLECRCLGTSWICTDSISSSTT